MEDSKKRKGVTPEDGSMIELTPAMEIPRSAGTKIIDLTEVLQAQPAKAVPERQPVVAPDQPAAGKTLDSAATKTVPLSDIESAVDAAFDIIEIEHSVEDAPVAGFPESEAPERHAAIDDVSEPFMVEPETAFTTEEAAVEPAGEEKEPELSLADAEVEESAAEMVEEAAISEETLAGPAEAQSGIEDALDVVDLVLDDDLDLAMKIAEPLPADTPEKVETGLSAMDEDAMATAEAFEESLAPDDTMDLTDKVVPIDLIETEATPAAESGEEDSVIEVDFGAVLESEAIVAPPAAERRDEDEAIIELTEITESAAMEAPDQLPAETAGEEIVLTDRIELEAFAPVQEAPAGPGPEAREEEDFIELIDIAGFDKPAAHSVETAEADHEASSIELTEIVEPGGLGTVEAPRIADEDDDDIILLTDIVDPAEVAALLQAQAGGLADAYDDGTIDLTEIVDPAELAAAQSDGPAGLAAEEDEAIELNDVVDPAQVAAALEESRTELYDDDDEDVIELSDKVDDDEPERGPGTAAVATETEVADRVIRLDSILDHVRRNREKLVEDITQGVEEALVRETMGGDGGGDGMAIGKDLEDIKGRTGESATPNGEALEQAVEKVIRAKYGETIEQLIAKTVEKVVTREIESLKRNLLEDQDMIDE